MIESIKTYQGASASVSQCLVTLEGFIGHVDGQTIATETGDGGFIDEGTIDAADAVTAINGLIWSLEHCEARINELGAALSKASREMKATLESTATFYNDPPALAVATAKHTRDKRAP